ncbi:MAG: sugar ABC transporter ATP-binding protein [Fuerstiella sp.]|nr:sugar ABC transporter ATP-binding protein [Fuerstiella sp.]
MGSSVLLHISGISKSFPGVRALEDVSLRVHAGRVLGLVGENGAGKSTLIRILAGAHQPDRGKLTMDGQSVVFRDPVSAIRAGIGVIYQEFNLVPDLSPVENLFLGRESSLLNHRDERQRAKNVFERLGVSIPLDSPCRDLSVAQQQIVEIARALLRDVRLLVMDEPTAALTPREVDSLMQIIRELTLQGIGIIYVSHRLDEVFAISDTICVLRDGCHISTRPAEEFSRQSLIEMMVGRAITHEYPKRSVQVGDVRMRVRGLTRHNVVNNVSFNVRAGEILGITGLVGAGRTELLRLIFGADRPNSGTIEVDGQLLTIRSPRDAIRNGICLLTEDRKNEGLIQGRSVLENFSLASLPAFSRNGFIDSRTELAAFSKYVKSLQIRISSSRQQASSLSGGNQQKILLARWLERNARIVVFDEPTRGIDVGARHEIYQLMNSLAADGRAIVMVSSELPEILGMSDRILVMHAGHIAGEVREVPTATQEQLMTLAIDSSSTMAMSSQKRQDALG